MGSSEVIVYTMTGCGHCTGVKQYLKDKGIDFTERNVLEDDQAMVDFKEMGFRGTPVVVVGDEQIVGFDKARLEEVFSSGEEGGKTT